LSNGLRIVIEVMPTVRSAACGFLSRTGSRDETPELAGVSHFLEHMCFKGTPQRTWQQITIDFDNIGSFYNAYTGKDRTFYFGWVRTADIERQMEIVADMMRSTIPADEFEMEKKVVLEEIAMSNDSLEDVAYHVLHEQLYAGSPMAWPVLGYEASVGKLSRDAMVGYLQQHYAPNNLTLIVAGKVDPGAVVRAAKELTADWQPAALPANGRQAPRYGTGTTVRQIERFAQQAIFLAYPAASARDAEDEEAEALASILGATNSRFYWNIQQAGIAPRASAWHEKYEDCGLILLYALGEPDRAERMTKAMRKEAADVTSNGVTEQEVQRVRNKRRTSLAGEGEAPYYRLVQIADDISYLPKPRTVEERLDRVNRVTVDSINASIQKYPITQAECFVSTGPRKWPER
jgi:predicted Zn-dependent peptidase